MGFGSYEGHMVSAFWKQSYCLGLEVSRLTCEKMNFGSFSQLKSVILSHYAVLTLACTEDEGDWYLQTIVYRGRYKVFGKLASCAVTLK